ncbi:MAG: cytochrome c biogenesis protein [Pirellulaceae bacterium]
MRKHTPAAIAVWLLGVTSLSVQAGSDLPFDWRPWQSLVVQEGGRVKPLNSLAGETLQAVTHRRSWTDPETHRTLDAVELYLMLLFDWQGWDLPLDADHASGTHPAHRYFGSHQPDKWDRMPLIRVEDFALRKALGIPKDEKCISPFDVSQAKIEVPGTHEERPFVVWAEGLLRRPESERTAYEKKALELAHRYWSYQHHRMGHRLQVLPFPGSQTRHWMSVAELARARFDDQSDPTGQLRRAQSLFLSVRAAYAQKSGNDFQQASTAWLYMMTELGPQFGDYASLTKIRLEVMYSQWLPFRGAWICMMLACLCLLLHRVWGSKIFLLGAWSWYASAMAACVVGFAIRVWISGRAPVTNMYESVVFVGLGVALLGMLFEAVYGKRSVLAAAAAVATAMLILADISPTVLDPSWHPLQTVLRSNFWLALHVMTITLSYAAFALALGISNVTLGYFVMRADGHAVMDRLTCSTYRAIQVGVLLLAAGCMLGAVWADTRWGRFWGWDPKETWALIALLGYLAVLHISDAGWIRHFGLATFNVCCFLLVVMGWYGCNFILKIGLHNYGFGSGGRPFVISAVCMQVLWATAAAAQYAWQRRAAREDARLRRGATHFPNAADVVGNPAR